MWRGNGITWQAVQNAEPQALSRPPDSARAFQQEPRGLEGRRMEKDRLLPASQPEKSLPSPSWETQPTCSLPGSAHPLRAEQGAQVTLWEPRPTHGTSHLLQSRTWACITGLHAQELLESQQAPSAIRLGLVTV